MKLDKLSFPISFSLDDALASIKEDIEEKYWPEFKVKSSKLIYNPYWVFNFDAYSEAPSSPQNEGAEQVNESGTMAMDAISADFEESKEYLSESEPEPEHENPAKNPKQKNRDAQAKDFRLK